jgi:hypothetical protein
VKDLGAIASPLCQFSRDDRDGQQSEDINNGSNIKGDVPPGRKSVAIVLKELPSSLSE